MLPPLKIRGIAARRIPLLTFVALALAFISGCGAAPTAAADSTAKGPSSVVVVQGDAQIGQAGRDLSTPIVLRVIDANGVGMHGVTVTLLVAEGGGMVTPASDTTDSHGEFRAKWTLGPNATAQRITASVSGIPPVAVVATGLLPSQIVLVQGDHQVAKSGAALTNSVVVRVVGVGNVPMVGVTVGFQVLSGGGAMAPATVVTNALGEASTKWTLGSAGTNTALASAGALPTVSVSATATP